VVDSVGFDVASAFLGLANEKGWPHEGHIDYVDNTVDGFLRAAVRPRAVGETINLGAGHEISIGDLAHKVVEMVGGEIPIAQSDQRVRPDGSEVDRLLAAIERAGELLDWQPQVDLDDGLARTIEWLRENLARYRPEEYSV